MEHLYLTADLYGLVEELKKYSLEKDIIKFILNLDFITKNGNKVSLLKNENISKNIKYISDFLIKTYIIKLKYQVDNKIINRDEFNKLLSSFINSMGESFKVGLYNYDFTTINKVIKDRDNILNNYEKIVENREIKKH